MTAPATHINGDRGPRIWLYKRPFRVGFHEGVVLLEARLGGLFSSLWLDGEQVAEDATPASGEEAARNHRLTAILPDGKSLDVEAGYISWSNVGIAVCVAGELEHESHPGRRIALPERAARMVTQVGRDGQPAYDPDKLRRNKVPIAVDIATGLLFFILAKLTDLKTAALVGAGVGLALVAAQRFVKVDLIGGLALFGVVMLLISAGFAVAFEDDELIKQRSTIVGLIGAACFLFDGLLLKGRRLGHGINRYLAYTDVDERRLAIGMGLSGATMASANYLVVKLVSTEVWLFYTTFGDIPLSVGLVLLAIKWARRGPGGQAIPA
ncbi:MAG TPA: septation protein IspZ [Sphingomicrobium sp.]|nr:septation protein IspZ [Sphingomicrobium sp.]